MRAKELRDDAIWANARNAWDRYYLIMWQRQRCDESHSEDHTCDIPPLEAGNIEPAGQSSSIKNNAITADTERVAEIIFPAETAPSPHVADISEEEPMDPAFEITEKRLSAPAGRLKPAETPELFEARITETQQEAPEGDFIPARTDTPRTESGALHSDTFREEIAMASANGTPPGGFPKSIHGYNVGAVDDYVRKINSRLENLLSQVQSESVRADQSKRLLEQMTTELETIRRRASDAEKREIAALDSQKRSEEEVARLVHDLKEAREKMRGELEGALIDARQERDALLAEERRDTEAMVAEARMSAAAQVAEAHRLVETLQNQVAEMSSELDTLRALTGDNGAAYATMTQTAEAHHASSPSDLEARQNYARNQIDIVVTEARRQAEEAAERMAAVYRDHEEHVRALGTECEALVQRVRDAVDAQISQLPNLSVRSTVGAGSRLHSESARRGGEPEEKRTRDNREWRNGDWRNAS